MSDDRSSHQFEDVVARVMPRLLRVALTVGTVAEYRTWTDTEERRVSEVGRLLSLPGTLMLFAAAAAVGAVIFLPLRRRLRALEEAAGRIGSGDLAARADEAGHDEIAGLAGAFNRMSAELAARTEALSESDRVRRQMLADVSHELRTPLTAMRGYLDTLAMADVTLDSATRERYLRTVRHETGRLERVFEHVVRRHEGEAQAAGVRITTAVAPEADQVLADPGRLEQVTSNLVANALRHTPPGGSIHLDAAIVDGSYRLKVEDSGQGIPTAHLPHVFDRFYKADAARAGGAGGSGLGLSIVKAIVERHGGTVTAESRPGRTAFSIVLPRGVAEQVTGQSVPSANR